MTAWTRASGTVLSERRRSCGAVPVYGGGRFTWSTRRGVIIRTLSSY